jgi:hypothetical protein
MQHTGKEETARYGPPEVLRSRLRFSLAPLSPLSLSPLFDFSSIDDDELLGRSLSAATADRRLPVDKLNTSVD